jgi:hypothetical protein
MNSCEATLDAHYELVNDIDATPTKAWNDGKGFNPIGYRIITAVGEPEPAGSDNRTFSGSLDGNGHSISGLHINREKNNYTGMIVYAEDTALVENLRLDNITVEGDSNTGGLLAENFGTVRNVTVVGEVDGGGTTGGLVGTNKGPVSNSSADVDVTLVGKYADEGPESGNVAGDGYWMAGGLIGYNEAIVSNSSASGDVSGLQEAGGLIGDNNFGSTVSNSSASGDVTGSGSTGGLAGENDGLIEYSTASGTVSGGVDAGGLVGANLYGTVAHSRASGDVGGKETYPVGTLIGTNQQNVVVNSTATGESIGEQILPVIGSNLCDTSPCD